MFIPNSVLRHQHSYKIAGMQVECIIGITFFTGVVTAALKVSLAGFTPMIWFLISIQTVLITICTEVSTSKGSLNYSRKNPSRINIKETIANMMIEIVSIFLFFLTKPIMIPMNEAMPLKIINGPIKLGIIQSPNH